MNKNKNKQKPPFDALYLLGRFTKKWHCKLWVLFPWLGFSWHLDLQKRQRFVIIVNMWRVALSSESTPLRGVTVLWVRQHHYNKCQILQRNFYEGGNTPWAESMWDLKMQSPCLHIVPITVENALVLQSS